MRVAHSIKGNGRPNPTDPLAGTKRLGVPWLARIDGFDDRYGFARTFLDGKADWASASKRGRNVEYWWMLPPGVYECYRPYERKERYRRAFIRVTGGGEIEEIDQEDVEEHLTRSSIHHLGLDVLTAARQRIRRVMDDFPRVYVSFSGGKDSGVLLELACDEARERGRRIGVLFVDLEAQYRLTIDYVTEALDRHADVIDPFWLALPLNLRNAVSQYEPEWMCWDPDREVDWVRRPPAQAITDERRFPFFRRRMEFEDLVPEFAHWYADGQPCCCLVGIRTGESLNRWRTINSRRKKTHDGLAWTTWTGGPTFNAYPIYDWRTEDVWTFYGKLQRPYNRLYDRMHAAGLTIHQARICQPYGDDQRKGLWLFHVIEPETWTRVVARVNGANMGALYARRSGNVLGNIKVTKPDNLTWEEFARRLLLSMPEQLADHYWDKISVFTHWWRERGIDPIPDDGPANDKRTPSWTRICKMLLRNDYWAKGLSFSPTRPEAYQRYKAMMKRRRDEWGLT